ncbi:MAG TPA: serine hydrolase [Reyranella sp.]|nr:serine hydrolase [Reyranella sp.]
MARIVILSLALFTPALPVLAQTTPCDAPAAIDDGWTRATPAEVGLDGERLCGLDTFIHQWPQANIHAVVVVRHGKLAFERYYKGPDERLGHTNGVHQYGPTEKHDLRSATKSVTSLLIGIALGEGKYPDLDASVIDQLPQYAALRTADNARITSRHLLTMSAGLEWDEDRPYSDPRNSETIMDQAPDMYAYVLQRPAIAPPGTVYTYSSGGSALLGLVLTRSVGEQIDVYAREKLFLPLKITDTEWFGFFGRPEPASYGGLRMRPRDFAKIGQLLMTDGKWGDRQVVPAGWAARSTKPRINGAGLFFYGYQWWLGRSFMNGRELKWSAAVGWGGQRLYIVPDLDLVVAINAGHYGGPLQGVIPAGILNSVVLPAAKD